MHRLWSCWRSEMDLNSEDDLNGVPDLLEDDKRFSLFLTSKTTAGASAVLRETIVALTFRVSVPWRGARHRVCTAMQWYRLESDMFYSAIWVFARSTTPPPQELHVRWRLITWFWTSLEIVSMKEFLGNSSLQPLLVELPVLEWLEMCLSKVWSRRCWRSESKRTC